MLADEYHFLHEITIHKFYNASKTDLNIAPYLAYNNRDNNLVRRVYTNKSKYKIISGLQLH